MIGNCNLDSIDVRRKKAALKDAKDKAKVAAEAAAVSSSFVKPQSVNVSVSQTTTTTTSAKINSILTEKVPAPAPVLVQPQPQPQQVIQQVSKKPFPLAAIKKNTKPQRPSLSEQLASIG